MEKLKLIINHDALKTTPYEFDKRLKEESNKSLFLYNKKGAIEGLDYFNYAYAASKLMNKINKENEGNNE